MALSWGNGQASDFLGRDDGRTRGNLQAPITLVEYSDFTCGFCLKFFQETWPRLRDKYIETGKVRFLYRDFPRAFQGPGVDAAIAARCAGDQGRYRAEEHTSELQSRFDLVCRLLLEKKKKRHGRAPKGRR